MFYSDSNEERNYNLSTNKVFDNGSQEFSSIKRNQLKEFLDTKSFSFIQKPDTSLQNDYVIKELSISLPKVNLKKSRNVKLCYEIEIYTKDRKCWLNPQEVNFILKEETVKLK